MGGYPVRMRLSSSPKARGLSGGRFRWPSARAPPAVGAGPWAAGWNGLVEDGLLLRITGRNAESAWLQVMHPVATGELVWISQAHVELEGEVADLHRFRVVDAPPLPVPTEPFPVIVNNCPQWYAVTLDDEYLIDITDKYGLDLLAVARLNRIDPEVPLTVFEVCLYAPGTDTVIEGVEDAGKVDPPLGAVAVVVTGTVVNLRQRPGTDHATSGLVRSGDKLFVMGRNAASSWLLVVNPAAPDEWVWIYRSLTDINAADLQALVVVLVR